MDEVNAEDGKGGGASLYLVSCVSRKRTASCAARELYISPWFVKARAYVEATRCPWFILSAEYGLVGPDQVISPYECTLNTMRIAGRRAWARRVLDVLLPQLGAFERIAFFAGQRYRELLMPELVKTHARIEVPLRGLGIGKQLRWLSERTCA